LTTASTRRSPRSAVATHRAAEPRAVGLQRRQRLVRLREHVRDRVERAERRRKRAEAALRETKGVAARIDAGRLRPTSPFGLTYAIVSSIARRESEMVAEIAREVGLMEQRVMADVDEDPQKFLSELFAARHELLTIKTMAEQGGEIYRRAIKLTTFASPDGLERMKDVLDQYETVAHISDSQLVFLMGVTEFYRAEEYHQRYFEKNRLARFFSF
jgi:Mg2+ and Co2+ transporter CorA